MVGIWRWLPTHPSSDEVKEIVELCLYLPSGSSWQVIRWTSLYIKINLHCFILILLAFIQNYVNIGFEFHIKQRVFWKMETKIVWILIGSLIWRRRFSLKRLLAPFVTTSLHILRSLSFYSKCSILLIRHCYAIFLFRVAMVHHQAINIKCNVEILEENVMYLLIQWRLLCFVFLIIN
jgi:hypothetical protein